MPRASCNEQSSCLGSATVPLGSVAGVLLILHSAPAMSHRHAENVMQIAAFLRWFRIGSCWFQGRRAGNIAFCPCYERLTCRERFVMSSIPALVPQCFLLVP
jgi:hypothetical protein